MSRARCIASNNPDSTSRGALALEKALIAETCHDAFCGAFGTPEVGGEICDGFAGVLGKVCHNNSRIPPKTLRNIMRIIEARRSEIIDQWVIYFGSAKFYC